MRRALVLATVAFVWAPAAHAAPPSVSAQASAASGAAPLQVTLTASGDAASWHWDFGDGQNADGQTVVHAYRAGLFTATVTGTSGTGETAQAQVRLVSIGLTLAKPRHFVDFGKRLTFHGKLVPNVGSVFVYRGTKLIARGRVRKHGAWRATARILAPGDYVARVAGVTTSPVPVLMRPRVTAELQGAGVVGSRLAIVASARPAALAFRLRVFRRSVALVDRTARGSLRIPLATGRPVDYVVRIETTPAPGFVASMRKLHATVVQPSLHEGSAGPSVRELEQRLWNLHYALKGVDGSYGEDTYFAVTAFQKVHGLDRTGTVNAAFWRQLASASIPRARYPAGNHVEVDKTRQVLFEVRGGRVQLVVPVSTGATGNTPVGTWHVYSRIFGWSWVLWYPAYFLRGFAIHGYPDVPPYPASHGCVRVPMWIAPKLLDMHPLGYTVRIYY